MVKGCALVTGAARRIGRVLALEAAKSGYDVAIHHRDARVDAESLAAQIGALGRRTVVLAADLADARELTALMPAAAAALGPVTLLVNCASLFDDDRLQTLTAASWDAHMAVNLKAPILLTQALAQGLAGAPGLVVNICDQRVTHPNPLFFSYTLSKMALHAATHTAAQALAPSIRVNAIGPGPVLASIHQDQAAFMAEVAATPLGRAVALGEIAAALRYLIDADSVTGQMISVDAGQHLAWRTPDIQEP